MLDFISLNMLHCGTVLLTQGADDTLYGKLSWTQILESLQKCWNIWTMFFKLGWVTQSAYLAYVAGEVMTCLKML